MHTLRAFVSHSSHDSEYVLQVCALLNRHMTAFAYEEHQRAGSFVDTINSRLADAKVFVIFFGETFETSRWVQFEANAAIAMANQGDSLKIIPVMLHRAAAGHPIFKSLAAHSCVAAATATGVIPAYACAKQIVTLLSLNWNAEDDLPTNPHLFSYEKDIIRFFSRTLELGTDLYRKAPDEKQEALREELRMKIAEGCPATWPTVVNLVTTHGSHTYQNGLLAARHDPNAMVATAALSTYLKHMDVMSVPEARPRNELLFPVNGERGSLRVAIAVLGGIAPGINAVIDGIVQRHWNYQHKHGHELTVLGFANGLHGVMHVEPSELVPDERHARGQHGGRRLATSEFANQGGSMLGTSRTAALLEPARLNTLHDIIRELNRRQIDILYVIGGDGTMRAAHALHSVASESPGNRKIPVSVVAIPKTMDNDILWVWQSFGFMSAVEKSREFIQHLHTEVSSNPRVCVLQLFGSDSGFVVSHAVLASAAGHCDVALIPEVEFSLLGLADHLESVMKERGQHIPSGMVVMAETAIPVDARYYLPRSSGVPNYTLPKEIRQFRVDDVTAVRAALAQTLDSSEVSAIFDFDARRAENKRIEGQTSDALRTGGLKLVMQGLETILRSRGTYRDVRFNELRMLRNEPRHLVRAIPPSTADIVMGQRLGTLAVDNAMAGYTDFMISQWLTEYVLVPLKLVVLGRKRIPEQGIFWQSVRAKTGQPPDLVKPWPRKGHG
jgi:6-phosphofructokinase 1